MKPIVQQKTKWNHAEGQDAAGNPVIEKVAPKEILTSEAVFGTPWGNIGWLGGFSIATALLIWRVRKADSSIGNLIGIAFLGVIVALSGLKVKDVVMKGI